MVMEETVLALCESYQMLLDQLACCELQTDHLQLHTAVACGEAAHGLNQMRKRKCCFSGHPSVCASENAGLLRPQEAHLAVDHCA